MTHQQAMETILNAEPKDDWAAFMSEEMAHEYALECAMEQVLSGRI